MGSISIHLPNNNKNMITREQFTNALTAIEEQIRKDREKAKLLEKVFTDSYVVSWDTDTVIEGFISLLSQLLGEPNNDWVYWYLWENKFNPGAKPCNEATDANGKSYTINDPGELYDFLKALEG